jgi:hypothetical protein
MLADRDGMRARQSSGASERARRRKARWRCGGYVWREAGAAEEVRRRMRLGIEAQTLRVVPGGVGVGERREVSPM